ncbi:MAG: periplasmic heavy metal sensor [Alphaproteobacteria bacterium]|nr:periplasmic heavy metal sensor [Alphaproteobacteria bacterium]
MKMQSRNFIVMLILTALTASAAGWAGARYGLAHSEQSQNIDAVLHRDLHLTPEQDRQLEVLEKNFAKERAALEHDMRESNIALARAITQQPTYDHDARHAIERFHVAMRALQEKTVQHVLAMRSLLTPSQKKAFDKSINHALGAEGP